jgi:hypothetical protein
MSFLKSTCWNIFFWSCTGICSIETRKTFIFMIGIMINNIHHHSGSRTTGFNTDNTKAQCYPPSWDDRLAVHACPRTLTCNAVFCIVTYSGFSIHDGTLLHSKSQYTTVKHSRQLLEHTYTSDPHGTGTLIPIEFFQQDLLWQSPNTHSHSCSQKTSKHTSGQSIVGLSVHLHTTTALRRIVLH